MMDKLTLISGTLFLVADMFALTSLVLPDWIVTEVGGDTRLGLMVTCVTSHRRPLLPSLMIHLYSSFMPHETFIFFIHFYKLQFHLTFQVHLQGVWI